MSDVELRIEHERQGATETPSCSREFWDLMLVLGNAFGWKPLGTSYLPTSFKVAPGQRIRRHDYRPGAWSDAKRLTAEDTFAWAAALRTALNSPYLDNMLARQQDGDAAQPHAPIEFDAVTIREPMDNFIGLLRKGALLFATQVPDTEHMADTPRLENA